MEPAQPVRGGRLALALAHPRDSPISQLLAHLHIPPGALLSDEGKRTYRAEARTSYADYAEYLRKNHPYQPPEPQLPSYASDEPRTRRPPRKPGAEPPDLVGIAAEVDAFAYLIASRALTPPLAIGLFGDWGSGKSYFLRSMRRRIDQLVRTEVTEGDQPPFYQKIAQIEFNAWQYVEGNLWASLLEHLFRNLRCANEDNDNLLEARRHELLTQIAERTEEHCRAVKKTRRADREAGTDAEGGAGQNQ